MVVAATGSQRLTGCSMRRAVSIAGGIPGIVPLMRNLLTMAACAGLAWGTPDRVRADDSGPSAVPPPAREVEVLASLPVGRGIASVLRPVGRRAAGRADELIVHFHGGVDTVRAAMQQSGREETVLVVTMPGLSTAYAKPFRDDPALFSTLLARAAEADGGAAEPSRWKRITLSCFSAGYAAVREILRSPDADRIDALVAADSIYAGNEGEPPERIVSRQDMAGFLAFARLAAAGQRVFVVAHSAQQTPYASTTETADYLLAGVSARRSPLPPSADEEFAPVSQGRRGRLLVTGHAGASAAAHLHHLRILGRHWAAAASLDR